MKAFWHVRCRVMSSRRPCALWPGGGQHGLDIVLWFFLQTVWQLGQGSLVLVALANDITLPNVFKQPYHSDRYYVNIWQTFCVCVGSCVVFSWPPAFCVWLRFTCCVALAVASIGCSKRLLMCSYTYCLPIVEKVFKSFNGKLHFHTNSNSFT